MYRKLDAAVCSTLFTAPSPNDRQSVGRLCSLRVPVLLSLPVLFEANPTYHCHFMPKYLHIDL